MANITPQQLTQLQADLGAIQNKLSGYGQNPPWSGQHGCFASGSEKSQVAAVISRINSVLSTWNT